MRGVVERVVGAVLLPPSCPGCGAVGSAPCPSCWRGLRPAPPGPTPPGLDRCRSLLAYEGVGRELIARLKYRNARSSLTWLASGMAGLVATWGTDVVTWAPTSAPRRRARGYDQAELLARGVAAELSLPCIGLLRRRPGSPQTGRSRDERRRGPVFAARASPRARAVTSSGCSVLLVDDLLTTGATLTAAAASLRAAGVPAVAALTAGRTPRRSPVPRPGPGSAEP